MDKGKIISFQTQGVGTKIEVLVDKSVWFTADQIART